MKNPVTKKRYCLHIILMKRDKNIIKVGSRGAGRGRGGGVGVGGA